MCIVWKKINLNYISVNHILTLLEVIIEVPCVGPQPLGLTTCCAHVWLNLGHMGCHSIPNNKLSSTTRSWW